MWTEPGNITIGHRHMDVEIRAKAVQLVFWEYINGIFIAVFLIVVFLLQQYGVPGGDTEIFGLANTATT
jgi:hypothetical protein